MGALGDTGGADPIVVVTIEIGDVWMERGGVGLGYPEVVERD